MRNTRALGIVVFLESLLIWVPMIILGTAIQWPASLSQPASVVLPHLAQNAEAVRLGYLSYLLYSVAFFPMAYAMIAHAEGGKIQSHLGWIAVGFAAISTLARSIGISRWLTAMPVLAQEWQTQPGREVEVAYNMLNSFAGGLGESFGVGLFAGIWAIVLASLLIRNRAVPGWLGWSGLVAGVCVLGPVVELMGFDLGVGITITTGVLHLWWMAYGLRLWIRPSAPSHPKILR